MDELDEYGNPIIRQPAPEPEPVAPASTWGDWLGNAWGTVTDTVGSVADAVGNAVSGAADTVSSWFQPAEEPVTAPAGDPWNNYFYHDPTPVQQSNDWDNSYTKPAAPAVDYSMFNSDGSLMEPEYSEPLSEPKAYTAPADDNVMAPRGWNVNSGDAEAKQYLADGGNIMGERGWNNTGTPEAAQYLADGGNVMAQNGQDADTQAYLANIKNVIDENNKPEATPKGDLRLSDAANAVLSFPSLGSAKAGAQAGLDIYNYYQKHKEDIESGKVTTAEMGIDFGLLDVLPKVGKSIEKGINLWDAVTSGKPKTKGQIDLEGKDPWGLVKKADEMGYSPESATGEFVRKVVNPNASTFNKFTSGVGALGDVFQAGAYAVEKGIGIATLNAPRLKALEEIPELGKYKDSLGRLGGLVNLSPVAVALRGLTQPPGTFINKVYNDKPVYLSQVANEYDAYAAKNGWKVDYDVPKTLADIALIKDEGERNKALAALFTRQGFADQRKTSAGKTAEIAYSSLDAQQRAIKRVSFGEDPNTVMHGLSKPNPKASLLKDQEDYADKVKLAIEVAGRQAAYDADQAGYTPEAKAALISKAMTAKAQTISSTGRIEGEANIFAEMLGQMVLDPMNVLEVTKIPGVLNVVERGKGITLARDLTKAVDATDEAAVFAAEVAKYQKLTRAPEFVAKIAVAADQAEAAAKAAGTVYKPTVKDFLVSLIDNKFIGRTADTAAHYKAQESITSLGQLVHDPSHFRSPEELVQVLKGYLQQDFQPVEGLSKFSDHVLDGTANSAAWQLGREYSQAAADELLKLANSKTIWSTVDADGKATKLLNSKAFVEKAIEIIGKVRGDKVSEYYKAAGGVEQTRAAVDNIVKMIKGQILSPIFLNTPAQAIQQTVGDRMSSIIDGNWATNIVDGKGWRERFANVAKTGRGFNSQLEGLSDGIQAAQGVKGNSVWTNITHGILKAGAKGEADRWSRSYLGAYEKYIDKVSNYKIGAELAAKMTPDEVKMVENALNIEHRDPNQVKDIIAKIARGEYKPVDLAEMAGMDNTIFKSKLQTQDRGWLNSLYQRASDEKWTPEKLRETLEGALEEKRNLAKAAMARATQTATTTNPPPHVKLGQDISDEFAMAINDIKTGDIDEPTRAALGKHLQEQTAARTAHMQETNRIAAGIVADTSLIPVEKRADMFHSLFNDEEKLSTAYDAHSLRIRNEMESALKDIPTTPDRFVQRNQVWETYYAEKRSAAQEMNEAKTALHQKYADALKTGDTTIVDSNKTSALEQLKELHTRRNEIVGKYAAATNPERAAYGSADAWEMSQLDGRIAHFNARDGAMRAAYDIGKENPALIGSAFRHVKDAEHDTQIAYDIADAWRRAFENRASINPAYTTKQQDIAQKWKEAFEYAKNRNRAAEWAIRDEGRVRSPNVSDVLEKLNYGKSQREALIQASATSDGYAKLSKILREGKPLEAAAPIAAGAKPVKQQIYDAAIARGHAMRQDGTIDPKRLLDSVNANRELGTPRFTQKDIFGARSQEALEALKKPLKTGEAPTLVTGEVKRATESVAKVSKQVKQVEGQIDDAQKLIDAARAKIAADMAEFSKTGNHLPGIDIHSEHSKINVWENQVKAYQNNLKNKTAELETAKNTLEAAKGKGAPVAAAKPAEVIEYGKPGSRHVGTPESVAYNEKGGWKIHLPVENKDYAIVDEWIDKNHAGQYKLLRGGDPQIKDFTIYVGSKDDADAMAKKIHDEIGKYLIPPKEPLSEDRQLYPNVFARFDPGNNNFMGTKGWDNSKAGWRYGIDGIPFDGDTARSRAIDKKVITKDSPEVKAIDAHLKSVYGDYYTGSGKTVAAAPTNVASSATTGAASPVAAVDAAVDPVDDVANVINQQAAAHHTTRVGTPPTEIELHQNALKDIEEVLNNAISNIPNIHGKLMANNEAKAWQGIAKELGEHLSKQAFQFRYDTAHIAEALANFSLNDYNDRAGFDSLMQLISPYSYWGSRQGKNYMYRMMENPTLYTHFQKLNNFEEEYNKQRGTPEHMKGKYNLNEMTGGLVSENSPLNSFYAQWKTPAMPMNNLFHIGYDDPVRERTSWQSIYDALPVLGLGPNPIFDIAIRGLGMLVNKTNPDGTPMSKEEIEKQMANYGPASSSPLWGIGAGIGGVTSAMGMNGGMGINPEALLNTAAGVTMRSQETRDIGNAISSQEFLRQANPNYNPQTGVLAQSIHERVNGNAKMRDHYMLDNPKAVARELAVDMKVSEKDAEIALYTYREGVKEASTKRGLIRLFNSLTAMQGAFYGEGEKARDKEQRQERAVGYNADTGYGSLKARQEVQAANPATQTLRAQWATYPGESKDPLVQWEWMEKDRISKSFDDMKDAYIKAHPEDKNGPKKIEDQKWKAWNAVSPAPLKPGETAPATGWEADLAKLASDMKLGKLNSSEVKPIEVPYAPKSIWGANPDEVIEIRKNEILKSYMDKKPSSVDFMDGSGELDFKKYKAALDGWANNAKERLMKDPTTAAVLAQAGKDSEDTQKALNKWLGEVKPDDIKTFKARYDSPLEAMQAVWFDKVYGSATEQYNKLKEGGSKTAWENTIGAIGPMNEDALFKMVKKEYPNLFTDEQLKSALKGITMPSAKDVGIANKDKDLLAVDKAVDSFKATLNGLIPPGKVKSDLLKQNALIAGVQSALFDSEQRKKLTPAMIAEAEMMIRGAANANYIKPNPEEWAKVVAIEKARDEKMQSSYGDGWRDKIGAYFDMSPADRAASVAKYAGLAALVADYTNATKGNTLYEKYHGYKAAGLDGKTGSGGGSGYSTGKSSSSGGSEAGSGAFWDSYHDLTSEEKSQLTKNNPSIKRLLDPATRSGVSATEWAEYNKLVLGKTTKEQLRAAVEAGQTVEQAASTFWGTYRTATTAIKTALAKSDPILAKIVDEKTRGTATKEDFQHAARLFDAVGAVQKAASSGGGGGGSSKAAAPKAAKEPAAKDVSSDIQKQMARLALGLSPVAGKDKAQPVIKATPLKKDSPIKDQMFDTFFSVPLEHRAAMMKDSPLLKLIVNGGAKKAEKDADYIRAIAFMQTWTPAEKAAAKVTAQKAPFKPTSKTSSNYSPYTASSGRSGGGGGGRGGGGRGGGGGGSRFTNRKPPRGKRGPTASTPIDSIYTSK